MDELTKLASSLGGETGQADPTAALEGLTQAVQATGGIDGIVAKLRSAGLGEAVDSWVSPGPNQPVDPATLGEALGPDTVQQLSAGAGVDAGQLLAMLAAFLPRIIDMLTPDGQVPSGGLGQAAGGGLPGLGGLLGGLAGAAGAGGAGSGGRAEVGAVLGELGGLLGGSKGS
jgi:uncharacterized protein YidB (DUF937 family)